MSGQPFLRCRTMRRKVDKLGVVTCTVEDADRSGSRPIDNRKTQRRIQREGSEHANGDDTAAPEIGLMQGEVRGARDVVGAALPLFADQPALAVVALPSRQLFAMPFWRPWRAVGPGDGCADWRVFENRQCGHDVLLRMMVETKPPPG